MTIAILFASFAWMGNNVVNNLSALGKDFSFAFLGDPANYDINQRPIPYTSQSTNARAMAVGIINTALVAALGIVLTTIMGLFVAIARLSPNWLLSRIAYVYIEYVRNVPVLLHILLVYGVVINVFPDPRGGGSWVSFFDVAFLSNRGLAIPKPIPHQGFEWVVVAFVVACVAAYVIRRRARRRQTLTGEQTMVFLPSLALIVGLPLVAVLVLNDAVNLEIPEIGRFNVRGGLILKPEYFALTLSLSLYTSAFVAEVIRAGILSVSKGQKEAAGALGFGRMRALRLIILPQALRVAIPPMTNQYLNLTKNSSLAIAIGYQDIVGTIGGITLNQTGREIECMILVLSLYLAFSLFISFILNIYNRSIALVER
ncbi:MAG: ABC transporter permease subunit [Alphaproteobacteria bacterium]|nr:ABC transporter permease subunit [Alphaproteobacteria bacterium]